MKKTAAVCAAALIMMSMASCTTNAAHKGNSSSVAASSSSGSSPSASSSKSTFKQNQSSSQSSSQVQASSAIKVHESSDPEVIRFYTEAAKYYTAKNYTAAVNDCDKALKIDPLCYQALNIKGAAQYYATGDPQQGLPYLDKCISINPNYMFGYFNKALIYKGKKDWDMSIGLFNKAIELMPDYAWSYYGISTIYADRNMVPQSLKYLKIAIEKDPTVKETARVQSHYDRMRGNPDFQALVK